MSMHWAELGAHSLPVVTLEEKIGVMWVELRSRDGVGIGSWENLFWRIFERKRPWKNERKWHLVELLSNARENSIWALHFCLESWKTMGLIPTTSWGPTWTSWRRIGLELGVKSLHERGKRFSSVSSTSFYLIPRIFWESLTLYKLFLKLGDGHFG